MAWAKVEHQFDQLDPNSPDLANLYNAKSHLELLRARITSVQVKAAPLR